MAAGDHIFISLRRGAVPFRHHGIDMGDGTVVHLAPEEGVPLALRDWQGRIRVRRDSLEDFSQGKPVQTQRHARPLPQEQIVRRAIRSIGRTGYDLLDHNCEHFATWCATGHWHSEQIDRSREMVERGLSVVTKTAWMVTRSTTARRLLRTPARMHPAYLLADGVEMSVCMIACSRRVPLEKTQRLARAAGTTTAAIVGTVVGGPAGAAAGIALHTLSGEIGQWGSRTLHRAWRLMSKQSRPDTVNSAPLPPNRHST